MGRRSVYKLMISISCHIPAFSLQMVFEINIRILRDRFPIPRKKHAGRMTYPELLAAIQNLGCARFDWHRYAFHSMATHDDATLSHKYQAKAARSASACIGKFLRMGNDLLGVPSNLAQRLRLVDRFPCRLSECVSSISSISPQQTRQGISHDLLHWM